MGFNSERVRKAVQILSRCTFDDMAEINRRLGGEPGTAAGVREPRRPKPSAPGAKPFLSDGAEGA